MILRRPKQKQTNPTDAIIQHYIQHVYQYDNHQIEKRVHIAETSGEILISGINKILRAITLQPEDQFMDLGSGTGKVVLHFFLRTNILSASGIEIVSSQNEYAHAIAARVSRDLPELFQGSRNLRYIKGDFLIEPFHEATILLIASPCFTPSMLDKISDIINHNANIHTVISLRPLIKMERLRCQRVFNVECSWDSSLCYIYGE